MIDLFQPDGGLRFPIMNADIFVNRPDQIRNASECPPSNPFPGQFSEPSFDHVQPGRIHRREVEMKTLVFGQPLFDDRVGMRSIVIQDQTKITAAGHCQQPRKSAPEKPAGAKNPPAPTKSQ